MAYLRGMTVRVTTTAFDTLEIVCDLEAAGVERRQAEAHAEAMAKAANAGHGELATRTDMANLETRLTVRLVGIAIGQVALIVALLKLFP